MKLTLATAIAFGAVTGACSAIAQPACEGGWNSSVPDLGTAYPPQFTQWDPDGEGAQRPLLVWGLGVEGSALDNSLGAWDGVNLIALSGATWDRVTAVGTWHGKLVVAGDVRFPKQASISTVAVFDGTTWEVLGAPGVDSWVYKVAEFQGDLYVCGGIYWEKGGPLDGVARFDGSAWGPLGLGVDESVSALCADGERLLVAGNFMNAGGEWIPTLAAWDGQSWTAPTSTPAWRVYNVDVYNGQICVPYPQGVAMWDGQTWNILEKPTEEGDPFGVGNVHMVKAVGGDLYVAMNTCTSYVSIEGEGEGGQWCSAIANLARWDGVQWQLFEGSWNERYYTTIEPYGQEIMLGQSWRPVFANPVARLSTSGLPWFIDQPREATVDTGAALTLTAATISGYDADGPSRSSGCATASRSSTAPAELRPAGASCRTARACSTPRSARRSSSRAPGPPTRATTAAS